MEKIKKSIGLKENNYFLSTSEIETNYEIFNSLIDNSLTVANKLDNDENIDKIFDNIMIHFLENFTETIKFMDKIKEQQFTLSENPLKYSYFTSSEQKEIESKIKDSYVEISRKLNKENNFYLKKLQEKLDIFLIQNKENLKKIINELIVLFSEEDLKKLSDYYNKGFENSISILGKL